MIKLTLRTAAFLIAVATPALADSQIWNIAEVTQSVRGPEGQWHINIDSDNKISGTASMQSATGVVLTYTLKGSIKGSDFTVNMSERTDGKKGCVSTGQSTALEDQKSHRLFGEVNCEGNVKFYVKGGY